MAVIFDTLEFSDDLTKINIECHLDDDSVDAGYYIQEVDIEYYKNRLATGLPSRKACKITGLHSTELPLVGDNAVDVEYVNQSTGEVATDFEGALYYIIVWVNKEENEVSENIPIPIVDSNTDYTDLEAYAGVVLDWKTFYDIGMGHVVAMTRRCNRYACEIPAGFEQFILLWHAFQLAYEAHDLEQLDFLWARLMGQGNVSAKCNCG